MWTLIIQARATSTRLPGKIFKQVNGRSLLEWQIERLKNVPSQPKIVVATTTNKSDDLTVDLAKKLKVEIYRGSEDDVLSRYYEAAVHYGADPIGRVTSDCPLIDSDIIESVYSLFKSSKAKYASNTLKRSFPRGLDIEVFDFHSLNRAHEEATLLSDREHVTPYIRNHLSSGELANLEYTTDQSFHRWTVDTAEDFMLIEKIFKEIHGRESSVRLSDLLSLFQKFPEWKNINSHIEQKKDH